MTPNIKLERPPNYDQILAAFPGAAKSGVIFAYGDTIWNPSGAQLAPAIIAHESVHLERQTGFVPEHLNAQIWWDRYIADPEFRYAEELAAHVAEYRAQWSGKDRNQRQALLMNTARRLIAPLYNYEVGFGRFTMRTAMQDIERFA